MTNSIVAAERTPRLSAKDPVRIEELPSTTAPWECCRLLAGLPHLICLESVKGPRHLCRYSYVAADPFLWITAHGRHVELTDCTGDIPLHRIKNADPFAVLSEQLAGYSCATIEGFPPFQGGAAGLFGYELSQHLERLPRPEQDEFGVPDMAIGFYDWVIAFDHHEDRCWLISTGLPHSRPRERRQRSRRRFEQIAGFLERRNPAPPQHGSTPSQPTVEPAGFAVPGLPGLRSNFDESTYLQTIRRAIEYVHAGDCFQVNIAQRLLYPAKIEALELYRRLRKSNPAPFAGFFDLGEFAVVSASPERFMRLRAGHVETRPIKGTRPRGQTPDEDQTNMHALRSSQKDIAENVMIVDLLRNDLGRVCEYGSVRVNQVCEIETYEYVHHLVSEVRGKLREGLGGIDLLRASFPGGSVTGAPKIRAMEIIAELERVARGPYCGSLGFVGFDGTMDSNILIRTFTVGKGWTQFPVGGGIVADSAPQMEYEETWHKAKGSLKALE